MFWDAIASSASAGIRWCGREALRSAWLILLSIITIALCGVVIYAIIMPAYNNPRSRIYTSRLGYASVIRSQNRPFPVRTAIAQRRDMHSRVMGEGLVQSEPIQVPLIAMGRITQVLAKEGDRVKKGQPLVKVDDTRIQFKIAAASASLETARAELQRVKVGSVNILEKERPDLERIRIVAAKRESEVARRLANMYRDLRDKGAISEEKHLQAELDAIRAETRLEELRLGINVAEVGLKQSVEIAEAAIREAKLQLDHRRSELRDYTAIAPADGIIERVVFHEGEYNQDPGKPAMVIASGGWFEAYVDQASIGDVHEGDRAEVRLAAFPGRVIEGHVEQVLRIVNFSLGGPETTRPIRPLGTGAPEWPATFRVRIHVSQEDERIMTPGMTGFTRIIRQKNALAVPRGGVTCTSGKRAIVLVVTPGGNNVDADGQGSLYQARDVELGTTDGDWVEVIDGLQPGDRVIVENHEILQP
ncbi:MAG: efflux RND transporter periplasmic adaptor subunit, partial [Planctomycetota bacterium]